MIIQANSFATISQTNKGLSTETSTERFVDTMDKTLTSRDKKDHVADRISNKDEPQSVAEKDLHHHAAYQVKTEASDFAPTDPNPHPAESHGLPTAQEQLGSQIQLLLGQVSEKGETAKTEGKALLSQAGRKIVSGLAASAQQQGTEVDQVDALMPETAQRGKANLREPLWNPMGSSSARAVLEQVNRVSLLARGTEPTRAAEADKRLSSGLSHERPMFKADGNSSLLPAKDQPVSVIADMAEDFVLQPVTASQVAVPVTALPLTAGVLNQTVNTPAWQQEIGQQLLIFYRHGIQNAELRLHPAELGELKISMHVVNNQAQMHFVTENYQVRAALEAAIPHLRTSLAESGINLGQSSVGGEGASSGQFGQRRPQYAGNSDSEDPALVIGEPETTPAPQNRHFNGINTFV